jgi:hypothetical protein
VWSAADVVTHVGLIATWYHQTLDRAEAGDPTPSLDAATFDEWTVAEVRAAGRAPVRVRLDAFVTSATAYAARLPDAWELPFGYLRGTISAGRHAALAAVEWHVHAWDIARAGGFSHTPTRPDVLAAAAADAVAAAHGARVAQRVTPFVAGHQRDPWRTVLHRLGRA